MENFIDRVINEIVLRLTSSRSSRASQPSLFEQPPAQAAPAAGQAAEPAPIAPREPEPAPAQEALGRELHRVLAEAREELDVAVALVADLRASADGFSQRIAAMSQRLDRLGAEVEVAAASRAAEPQPVATQPPPAAVHPAPQTQGLQAQAQAPQIQPQPPHQAQAQAQPPAAQAQPPAAPAGAEATTAFAPQPPAAATPPGALAPPPAAPVEQPQPPAPAAAPQSPPPADAMPPHVAPPAEMGHYPQAEQPLVPASKTITLTVSSLANLTVVMVVEAALLKIPGVREVALRQLEGHQAMFEVRIEEGTALVTGLRKTLTLAFDLTESSDQHLGIKLTNAEPHPQPANGGGGASTPLA